MSVLSNWLKCLAGRQIVKRSQTLKISNNRVRTYADTPKSDVTSKQVMVNSLDIVTGILLLSMHLIT